MKKNRLSIALFLLAAGLLGISCGCSKHEGPEGNDTDGQETPAEPETPSEPDPVPERELAWNCMTDPATWVYHSPAMNQARFDLYKEIGVTVLRAEYRWDMAENAEGAWRTEDQFYNYLQLAKENGFRIKLILGTLSDRPAWFATKHPETKLFNPDGIQAAGSLSYWYDGFEEAVTRVTRKMIETLKEKDLWDNVDYIIPSLGTAGEPIYPPQWTQPAISEESFWCYGDNAKADFRAKMREKYKADLVEANKVWQTDFATWEDVTVLLPGEKKGLYWNDVLTWYRDSKREKVKWIIDFTVKELEGTGKKVIVYIPGVQYTQAEWNAALTSNTGGTGAIRIMDDTDYLLDFAAEKGAMVQYTGMSPGSENVKELTRVCQYLKNRNFNVPVWGENVGDEGTASKISNLQNQVNSNKLYGFDYTHSAYLFQNDKKTPVTSRLDALKALYSDLNRLHEE